MMLPSFCRETVKIKRAPLVESRGSKVRDWSAAQSASVPSCIVSVTASVGQAGTREQSEQSATLLAPPGTDVRIGDRVACSSGEFLVESAPYSVDGASGSLAHVVAGLSRWEG